MTATRERIKAELKLPRGLGRSDDLGCPSNTIGSALGRLQKLGEAFPAKVGHKTVRWFDTKERADAYLAQTPKPPKWGVTIYGRRGPAYMPGDPVVTSATKHTPDPRPPVRSLHTNTHGQLG